VSVTPTSLWSWSAAFTGDGFLLASIVIDPTSQGQSASLYRLETDGTLSARGAIGGDTSSPSKVSTAWSGSDLRVWYDGPWNADPTKTGTLLQRVGPDGTLIGSPVSLDGAEYGPMHLLTLAQDTLMVRDAYQDSGSTLRLLRLAPSGIAAWPETKVVHTDNKPPAQDMALQAGDAIVAWTDDSRLSLERIRIAP
jgi:hypothetical protein